MYPMSNNLNSNSIFDENFTKTIGKKNNTTTPVYSYNGQNNWSIFCFVCLFHFRIIFWVNTTGELDFRITFFNIPLILLCR